MLNSITIGALPTGSPVCTVGSAAPQSLHLSRTPRGTGAIASASFQVKIGTMTLVEGSSVNTIAANTNLALEVTSANGTQFRGVLVILNAEPNVNLVSNMFISPTSTLLQVQSSCSFSNYAGFTHTSNALKSSAQATINLPANQAAFLDVNVVVANNDAQGSFYYYSRYQVSTVVAAPVPAPVAPPRPAPVSAPIVPAPIAPSVPRTAPVPAPLAPKSVPVPVPTIIIAPVPAPTAPTPMTAPASSPTRASCGLLGLSIFCFNGCGLIRQILGRC